MSSADAMGKSQPRQLFKLLSGNQVAMVLFDPSSITAVNERVSANYAVQHARPCAPALLRAFAYGGNRLDVDKHSVEIFSKVGIIMGMAYALYQVESEPSPLAKDFRA